MTQDSQENIEVIIEALKPAGTDKLWVLMQEMRFHGQRDYFENMRIRLEEGGLIIVLASLNDKPVGYCLLNWAPKYAYFQVMKMPEIQDLNVLREYRQKGIGRKLIDFCEKKASDLGNKEMGIGVGLDKSFGPAQRLYTKMGYIPDGNGITYDRKQVAVGEFRPIDENLCMMMTKVLK